MALPPNPTILTYEASAVPSFALMAAKTFENKVIPIEVEILNGRGAQTTYSSGHGAFDTDLGEWMPLRQDICKLPYNADTLRIEFPLKYLPRSLSPLCCNDSEWSEPLEEITELYKEKGGYLYQAYCQMDALFQGLPFWRNNDSEEMKLNIINISDNVLPAYEFNDLPRTADQLVGTDRYQFESLIKNIEHALIGERHVLRLRIIATLGKDILEKVHPSQEFIEKLPEAKKAYLHRQGKYQKTRHYAFYKLGDIRQAMLHPTKIGAGLRWDLWNKPGKKIPVSVYGLDIESRTALRGRGTKQDFYSLLRNIKEYIVKLEKFDGDIFSQEAIMALGEIHFIMANLIKGGVFNRESSKSKKKDKANES